MRSLTGVSIGLFACRLIGCCCSSKHKAVQSRLIKAIAKPAAIFALRAEWRELHCLIIVICAAAVEVQAGAPYIATVASNSSSSMSSLMAL